MATKGGPRLFTDLDHSDMLWYMDITNKDCWDGSAISSTSKLYNLANLAEYMYPSDTSKATSTYHSLTRESVERFGTTDHNTAWRSNVNKQRFTAGNAGSMSAFCFLNGGIGSSYQSNNNIYLGGFNNRISFSMAGGGSSQWGGPLIYRHDGSGSLIHRLYGAGALLDNTWRSFGWSISADGNTTATCKVYHDGILVNSGTHTVSDSGTSQLPNGGGIMVMGAWSTGYGEYSGKYNNWMYFSTELDATDFKQLHNAFKSKYGA